MRPNFFLVGTTKGGTSTLDVWLRQHPMIGLPERKELHFFCRCPNPRLHLAGSQEEYHALIPKAQVRGEASPCYLYYREIPSRLASDYPDARVLISIRDPVERFWSHYLMNEVYRPTHLPPLAVLERNLERGYSNAIEDLVGVGMYHDQVARFLDVFPPGNVHVVFLEETKRDPEGTVEKIFDFLGLPSARVDTSVRDKEYVEPRGPLGRFFLRTPPVRRVGAALLPPRVRRLLKTRVLGDPGSKPSLDPESRERLQEIYREDVLRLEELLGRGVPWHWYRRDGRGSQHS